MMRRWWVVLWLAGLGTAVWSQGAPDVGGGGQAERLRIDSMRQQKTAELDAEESACLSRFAVTDCQNEVGVRRRQMLSDLKRQEAVLNAADRKQRGVEQLQREELKAADNVQRQRDAQTRTEKSVLQDRQKTQDDKQRSHRQRAQPVKSQAAVAKTGAVLDAETIEKNRQAYSDKQKALEKRRQERDQRLLDHGKGSQPLPLPP